MAAGAPRRNRSGTFRAHRTAHPRRDCRAARCGRSTARRWTRSGEAARGGSRAPARPTTRPRRRPARSRALQELREVLHDDVGPAAAQRLGLTGAVHADHPAERAGAPRLDARQRVLEDGRFGPLGLEQPRAVEEGVERRLAGELLALGDDAIDAGLEEVVYPGGDEHVLAVRARRDDGSTQRLIARRLHEADRALVRLDPLLADQLEHQLVLARAEGMHRLRLRRIGRRAHLQVDRARLQERADALQPWLTVHVLVVVGGAVELLERLPGPLRPVAQETVEHLLPRLGMDLRRLCEDAVQVEQARRDAIRQSKHDGVLPAQRRPEDSMSIDLLETHRESGAFPPNYVVVTSLITAKSAAVLIARNQNASITLKAGPDIALGGIADPRPSGRGALDRHEPRPGDPVRRRGRADAAVQDHGLRAQPVQRTAGQRLPAAGRGRRRARGSGLRGICRARLDRVACQRTDGGDRRPAGERPAASNPRSQANVRAPARVSQPAALTRGEPAETLAVSSTGACDGT